MLTNGDVFAGYRIDRLIGTGPTGTTYLAHNPDLPRADALKVVTTDLRNEPGFAEQFSRCADAASALTHPNIVTVYRHGITDDGFPWIAMEYVAGTDAEAALRAGLMTPARAMRIATDVATALDYAHQRGMLHLGIRPANFLLTNVPAGVEESGEHVLLEGFGVLRPTYDPTPPRECAMYTAPEVLFDGPVDGRTDVYSLGCSLFRLLTGRNPFPVLDDPVAAAEQRLHLVPPRVTDFAPQLPPQLNLVVGKAMAPHPDARYQSAREFAEALLEILPRNQFRPPQPPQPAAPPPPPPPQPVAPPEPPSRSLAPPPFTPPPAPRPPHPMAPPPSWAPEADMRPPAAQPFPAPAASSGKPKRWPLKIAAALAVIALATGGVVWWTSQKDDGSDDTPPKPPSTSAAPTTKMTSSPTPAPRDPAAEAALLPLLPAGYPPGACTPVDPAAGARATLACAPNADPGGPSAGRYSLMPNAEALRKAFDAIVAESTTVICPGNILSPGEWRHSANLQQKAGILFCGTKGTDVVVAWTTDEKLLLNVATSPSDGATLEQLFTWWGTHS